MQNPWAFQAHISHVAVGFPSSMQFCFICNVRSLGSAQDFLCNNLDYGLHKWFLFVRGVFSDKILSLFIVFLFLCFSAFHSAFSCWLRKMDILKSHSSSNCISRKVQVGRPQQNVVISSLYQAIMYLVPENGLGCSTELLS